MTSRPNEAAMHPASCQQVFGWMKWMPDHGKKAPQMQAVTNLLQYLQTMDYRLTFDPLKL
ncbi:hypothetical protein BBD41_26775 [Paenibacillus ihbetae]|uniref:Uncharacterized protein n=1 Tax=Paenibacillus ihbetae TaxID=1870820 RepID=A0A1B2E7G8_9BACL|nr:hypothetical protein BBD41_26775 [Paenibacillus ihbetae]